MRDISSTIADWLAKGVPFATARVLSTWGSSPRRPGAMMAITEDLDIVGSVSGGCIEGEVLEAAKDVVSGGPAVILEYGISDDAAWSVGLSCGGRVSVLLELFPAFAADPETRRLGIRIVEALQKSEPFIWITRLDAELPDHALLDPEGRPSVDSSDLQESLVDAAIEQYGARRTGPLQVEELRYFVHVVPPPSTLLVVGATDIATHLVRLAAGLDFTVVVIDPRTVFANPARFDPKPDQLDARWPQDVLPELRLGDETYAVLLTHDPKIDDPALVHLLASDVRYVGALGSSRTHARRRKRLLSAGLTPEQVDRIHGPVGLDIGASSPCEIALSVLAEIVRSRNRMEPDGSR